jgi:multidrug efflux pump subunit AcrA (membrane-fusion protein)
MNIREPVPTEDEKVTPLGDARPPSRGLYFLVAVVVLGALAWGAYGRWQQREAAIETQQAIADFVPEVRVAVAAAQDGPSILTLPGTVLPFDQARIFARATGYVAERHVDIGSRVAKGDLLLRIAAPDLDHQLAEAEARLVQMEGTLEQARAATEQSRSDATLADVTNTRTLRLATQGWYAGSRRRSARPRFAHGVNGSYNRNAKTAVSGGHIKQNCIIAAQHSDVDTRLTELQVA